MPRGEVEEVVVVVALGVKFIRTGSTAHIGISVVNCYAKFSYV